VKKELEVNIDPSPQNTLELSDDNITHIVDFFEHFKLSIPTYLLDAMSLFRKKMKAFSDDPANTIAEMEVIAAQNAVRCQLARCFLSHESNFFEDEVFDQVRANSKPISFSAFFDEQIRQACEE
jgi:hypothetical protein